jgi:linoleoyl-CoA desaturase
MDFIKFNKRDAFSKELAQEVNEYLKVNNKKKFGSWQIFMKVPFMFSLYLVPYFLMVFGVIENVWIMLLCSAIMGFGMSGIGLAIMHDANHGSFSKYGWVNKVMSYSMEVLGGNSLNWKIQHNVLHHSFTNVHDLDEDISPPGFLRFSPNEPVKKIHRFQMYYAWFFYGLMTLSWMTNKDFMQLIRYKKKDLLKSQGITYKKAMTQLIINKVLYYVGIALIPLLVMDINIWQWMLGFFLMHFISGSMLAFIFQPAHVIEETEFVKPDSYKVENPEESWAVHQMKTTANFENWNPIFTWYVGGLNYQIEHHLFPDISHIHYPKISKIVKKVADKHGVPYHYHKMWFGAIASHLKMLNNLGKA